MHIIAIEGLPLTGKTTLCKKIIDDLQTKGLKCLYCHHGHITNNQLTEKYYIDAKKYLAAWDRKNYDYMQYFIDLCILSLVSDYRYFQLKKMDYNKYDFILLDRHFTDQYVTADVFKVNYCEYIGIDEDDYYDFLLYCSYDELKRRASIRQDNHGNLTDFILSSKNIYYQFQKTYIQHFEKNSPPNHIINNECFNAKEIIDNFILSLNIG